MAIELSKCQLVSRAAKWGRRLNVDFHERRFVQWIDQALVPEGARLGNEGNKPVFRYGCRHYRRVLQIIRLYSRGTKDRDAILVELFLKEHGVGAHEVREALVKEFLRAIGSLNGLLRSARVDEVGEVPPKHKESLIRSFGPADSRFVQAEIVPGSDDLITVVRAMRSSDPESAARKVCRGKSLISNLGALMLGGMLVQDPKYRNEFAKLIQQATDQELETARGIMATLRVLYSVLGPYLSQNLQGAVEAFDVAFSQREFECFLLVLGLKFVAKHP